MKFTDIFQRHEGQPLFQLLPGIPKKTVPAPSSQASESVPIQTPLKSTTTLQLLHQLYTFYQVFISHIFSDDRHNVIA